MDKKSNDDKQGRIKRAEKLIPEGDYCYAIKRIEDDSKYGKIIYTYNCPYHIHIYKEDGWCKLMDYMIMDQCKSCGINGRDDEYEEYLQSLEGKK